MRTAKQKVALCFLLSLGDTRNERTVYGLQAQRLADTFQAETKASDRKRRGEGMPIKTQSASLPGVTLLRLKGCLCPLGAAGKHTGLCAHTHRLFPECLRATSLVLHPSQR